MLLAFLLIVNLAAFGAMGFDKSRARAGGRRVPERTLLLVALCGGSLGMFVGSTMFAHKTRKRPFRTYLTWIAVVQILALAAFAGAPLFETQP